MAGVLFRNFINNASTTYKYNTTSLKKIHTTTAYYAARKGTRAKARAKKVKIEVAKVGFIPHNQRGKDKIVKSIVNVHSDDTYKHVPVDDVYPLRYYRWIVYTAEDAVKAHQETHHKTMYNIPDALIYAHVDLNMEAVKAKKYIDNFTKITLYPHTFPRDEERTILAFVKGQELLKDATDAGATIVGGVELIKKIQVGEIKLADYDYVIAHPNILTDLVPLRGLMKRKFPNLHSGTLDTDIVGLVKKFASGVQYRTVKDEVQQNYGFIKAPVGRLNMEAKKIEENIDVLLKDIQASRPKRDGLFITKCLLETSHSREKFKIDPFVHVEREISKEVQAESDDEDDEAVAAKA